MISACQVRGVSWDSLAPSNWQSMRRTNPNVEQELPEVFADQPQEVDDYIRPEKTLFEKLEDWWDYIFSFLAPVDKQIELMQSLRTNGLFGFAMDYGEVFFIWGIIIRLISMGPQLYVHRNGVRLAQISPQLTEITNLEKKLKSDKSISTGDKRVIKEGYKRMRKALYAKHGCSQARSFVGSLTTPFMITAFMAIKRLATYDEELETTRFLWVKDLTMPDPTWILPSICVSLFVINFELNQAMSSGGRSNSRMYLRWGIRGGSLVFLYFFQSQPAGCFSYWIGMSLCGLLSPALLRWDAFRKFFNFPPKPIRVQEDAQESLIGTLLVKLGLKPPPKPSEKKKEPTTSFSSIRDFEVVFDAETKANPTR